MPNYFNKNNKDKDEEANIANFLKTFTTPANYESDSTADASWLEDDNLFADPNDIRNISIEDYKEARMPEYSEERIKRLQQIAQSIEQRVVKFSGVALPELGYKINYRNSLNEGQYLAVTTTEGPILVIAGAGSGKTRTVTYRVSYLIEKGIPAEEILLLTFTRKAANEIVKRTSMLLQNRSADRVMRGTYHAFSNYILRRFSNLIGIPQNFTIVDTVDCQDIIDLIRSELKFNKKSKAFPRKSRVHNIISKSRNCNITVQAVIEREFTGLMEFVGDITTIAKVYEKYKRANNIFDYDDLLEVLRDKLKENLPFRRKLQSMYRYIMVDEFQDTNVVQKEIVDLIAEKHQNVMVVGDDAQSIYAFRGANFENILTFPATYSTCKVIKLEQNYRSTQDILNFTNSIANNALLGYQKILTTTNKTPLKPIVASFYDQETEADYIVDKIMELREKNIPLNQVAVLYRSSFHGNFIQSALLRRNIPYVVVGGIKFIERRHVKDITAYLRIIMNPYDAVSWHRVLKLIPGIGKVTAGKVLDTVQQNQGKIDFSGFEKRKYGEGLKTLQKTLNDAARPVLNIATKIEVIRNYYDPLLRLQEDDADIRLQDVDVLYKLSAKYDELEKFLSDFALDPPNSKFQDRNSPLIDESEDKPVTLSTIHSSKGLEWYAVFVPHLLDGLFPSSRSLKKIEDLEEERRLFYVACSRAKEQLYLTYPSYFSAWGEFFTKPTRFVIEVSNDYYEIEDNK